MKNLNFNRFTKAKNLTAPEIEKKSLNFDATTSEQADLNRAGDHKKDRKRRFFFFI